jgi:hypothetical protein
MTVLCNKYLAIQDRLHGHELVFSKPFVWDNKRFNTCLTPQDAREWFAHNVRAVCYAPLFRCEQRHFSLPDGIAEQRAILVYLARLCDATLLEALDHHF